MIQAEEKTSRHLMKAKRRNLMLRRSGSRGCFEKRCGVSSWSGCARRGDGMETQL